MHVIGTNGYRCSQAKEKKCWNRASAQTEFVNAAIGESLTQQLKSLEPNLGEFHAKLGDFLHDGGERQKKIEQKKVEEKVLSAKMERLVKAIEDDNDDPSEMLVKRLKVIEMESARTKAEREQLEEDEQNQSTPSVEQLVKRIHEMIDALKSIDREDKPLIQNLIGKMTAVPHQQFNGKKIVLRGRFRFHPEAILPATTRLALKRICGEDLSQHFPSVPIDFDLFHRSHGPKLWKQALDIAEAENLTLEALGKRLGIGKRSAHIALQFGKAMREAGRTDPYIELIEPPASACRWR